MLKNHDSFFKLLASPLFTLFCIALAMALVIIGTLAQVEIGTFAAQQRFFNSFWVYATVGGAKLPVFPGGLTLAVLWLTNMLASMIQRTELYLSRKGLLITHGGIILLLIGQVFTQLASEELVMPIELRQNSNFAESRNQVELAVTIKDSASADQVVSIPFSLLKKDKVLTHPDLPFSIKTLQAYPNSRLRRLTRDEHGLATIGSGTSLALVSMPAPASDEEGSSAGAMIQITTNTGAKRERLLLSMENAEGEELSLNGQSITLVMRRARQYLPFSLTLLKFSHDVYPGTDIPRNFSSLVKIHNPEKNETREALIYMNNPLRYGGLAFYQASYGKNDTLSIFQVVRNPGWLVPYISCVLVCLGLIIEFLGHAFKKNVRLNA